MTPLVATLLSGLIAGALSVGCATLVAAAAPRTWIPMLVSYAIGALLGAVFLEILPRALAGGVGADEVSATVLVGILLFFILEKAVLWRHAHDHGGEPAADPHGRAGAMIVVGDAVHNFVDGIIIAAAFVSDFHVGLVTALAIIAHEIPQETGDFLVLLNTGMSRRRALVFNLISSAGTLVGGVLACLALESLRAHVPTLLALAAASMLYVAVADLIPGLHRRVDLRTSLSQILLIAMGIASIHVAHWLIGEPG